MAHTERHGHPAQNQPTHTQLAASDLQTEHTCLAQTAACGHRGRSSGVAIARAQRTRFAESRRTRFKYACEYNLVHLVLVVNTDHALKALELLKEGRARVDVIRAPKVSKDAVAEAYPADFVEAFEDCDSCIGIALDYMRFADRQNETAREYTARVKEEHLRWSCLTEEISLDEFRAAYCYKKKE